MVTELEPSTVTLGEVNVALCFPFVVTVEPEMVSPCVAPRLTVWLPVIVMALDELMLNTPVEASVVPVDEDVFICLAFRENVLHAIVILSEFCVMEEVFDESLTVIVTDVPFITMV